VENRIVIDYIDELKKFGIANKAIEHPALQKVADVVAFLKVGLSDTMPTMVMVGDGTYYAFVIRGECKLDFKKIKTAIGVKDLRFATYAEFTNLTGLPIGAARVYIPNAQTIIDPKVLEKEYLIGGSGRFDCSIQYKTADLPKILGSKIVDIIKALSQ